MCFLPRPWYSQGVRHIEHAPWASAMVDVTAKFFRIAIVTDDSASQSAGIKARIHKSEDGRTTLFWEFRLLLKAMLPSSYNEHPVEHYVRGRRASLSGTFDVISLAFADEYIPPKRA